MKNADKSFDVLIVGAGFVGLALARALSLCGQGVFRVGLVDRISPFDSKDKKFDGRSSSLSVSSRRMLQALGAWESITDHAQPMREIEITDSPVDVHERPVFLHFETNMTDGEPASYMVENFRLLQSLAEVNLGDPCVHLMSGQTVSSVDASGYQMVAELEDGQSLSCKLLVGADGRHSAMRRMAGIKTVGWSYNQTGIVATIAHEKPHEGRAVQHFLPSGPFAILPLTGNRSSLVWSEEQVLARQLMGGDEAFFMDHLGKRFGDRLGGFSLDGPRGAFPLAFSLARRFISKRLVLAGDAAHAVHPLAGQGLNVGFRDVAALAEVLIDARRLGLDIGSGPHLERYERWRRFDATINAFAMDGINRLFSNNSSLLRELRDFGLGIVNQSGFLKRFFVGEASGLRGEVPKLLRGELV